jgi:hypothetical protein
MFCFLFFCPPVMAAHKVCADRKNLPRRSPWRRRVNQNESNFVKRTQFLKNEKLSLTCYLTSKYENNSNNPAMQKRTQSKPNLAQSQLTCCWPSGTIGSQRTLVAPRSIPVAYAKSVWAIWYSVRDFISELWAFANFA